MKITEKVIDINRTKATIILDERSKFNGFVRWYAGPSDEKDLTTINHSYPTACDPAYPIHFLGTG